MPRRIKSRPDRLRDLLADVIGEKSLKQAEQDLQQDLALAQQMREEYNATPGFEGTFEDFQRLKLRALREPTSE